MQSLSPGDPATSWRAWLGWSSSMQSLSPGRRVLIPTHSGANFTTRCAARRPHVRGARSALGTEGGAQLPRRRVISARRGLRTRRRGTVKPLRGFLFKTISQISFVQCLYFHFFGRALSFGLTQTPHSLSVGFVSNLSSCSQHVIRARRSKHVVPKKTSINH